MVEAVKNQFVRSGDDKDTGLGKEVGQIDAPVVSPVPTTGVKKAEKEFTVIDDAADFLFEANGKTTDYPFEDLEIGQGMFIATAEGENTADNLEKMYKTLFNLRSQYGEIERDEHGDQLREHLTAETRKRTDDGLLQLVDGKPVVGANFVQPYKYAYYRNFVAKSVTKDQEIGNSKASADGIIVIRVA